MALACKESLAARRLGLGPDTSTETLDHARDLLGDSDSRISPAPLAINRESPTDEHAILRIWPESDSIDYTDTDSNPASVENAQVLIPESMEARRELITTLQKRVRKQVLRGS